MDTNEPQPIPEQDSSDPKVYFGKLAEEAKVNLASFRRQETGGEPLYFRTDNDGRPRFLVPPEEIARYQREISINDSLQAGDTAPAIAYLREEIAESEQQYNSAKAIAEKPLNPNDPRDREYAQAVQFRTKIHEELKLVDFSRLPADSLVDRIIEERLRANARTINESERGRAKQIQDQAKDTHDQAVAVLGKLVS